MNEQDFERWLSRVEKKLDKVTDDHEGRIRKLEGRISTAVGIAVTCGATGILSLLNIIFNSSGGIP